MACDTVAGSAFLPYGRAMPTQILQQHSGTACSASSSCCCQTGRQTSRQTSRPERLRLLALAETARLEACLDSLHARHILPSWTLLRGPESGLVMVRGRIGGQGQPFNVGEALVTRCCISLAAGCETSRQACGIPASDASASDTAAILGCGYVLGEKPRHAEMMAVLDALWQNEATAAILDTELLPELCSSLRARYEADSAAAAATKVDFFTLVRGEDKD